MRLLTRRESIFAGAMTGAALMTSLDAATAATAKDGTMSLRSQVGAQEPRKMVELEGMRIAYTDTQGNGPTVICLHAIGHGSRDFETLRARIGKQYRVIALDFPGQGNSTSDTKPPSGTRYTQLLAEFIEKLHIGPVTLLGNSIGGAASVRYASMYPEQVKGLVLCDSGGLTPPPDKQSQDYIQSYVEFFAAGRKGAPWFGAAFDGYYRTVLIAPAAEEERQRIVRSAYEIAPILEQAWQSFARPEESLWHLLPQISCPVLLAWARSDSILPLATNRPVFSRFPRHALELFDGGHAAFLEYPDRFEQKLRAFLRSV